MAIVKPDLSQQWASDGDKIAPSGAKIQAGWGPEIPPYQWENFIQNRQDEMLAYLNERGIGEWDNRTNYVGGGKSYVQGSDGVVYKSVAASGPASVVSNPTTDVTDTYWTVAFAPTTKASETVAGVVELATTAEAQSGTDDERAMTPLKVKQAIDSFVGSPDGTPGVVSALKLTTTGISAVVTITAAAVSVLNSAGKAEVLTNISIAPSLAVSGANGLDTGVSAASTWYSVWVIWNGTTTAGLFSLSATAPTMPVGYTHKIRVGWVRSDATGNKYPLRIVQRGSQVRYAPLAATNTPAVPVIAQGIQAAGTAYATGNFVPQTAGVIHGICSPDATYRSAVGPSAGVYDLFYITSGAGTPLSNSVFWALVLESTNIYGFQGGAASRTLAYGWEDNL